MLHVGRTSPMTNTQDWREWAIIVHRNSLEDNLRRLPRKRNQARFLEIIEKIKHIIQRLEAGCSRREWERLCSEL
jgi:hypothetical protein